MTETVLVHESEKKVGQGGGSAIIYIPKEVKEFIKKGDSIKIDIKIVGKKLIITASKQFFKFDLDDIKQIAKNNKFTIRDNTIADVRILQSAKKKISLNANINLQENMAYTYASISLTKENLTFDQYQSISSEAKKLKKNFNVITMPEGDIDTIKIMEDPKDYKLNEKEAFDLIVKSGRKIGMSITIRFNNKEHSINEIEAALQKIEKFRD